MLGGRGERERSYSIVSIVTKLWTGRSGVQFLVGRRDFPVLQNKQTSCGAHRNSHSVGTRVISTGVKQPGCEIDHSHLSSTKVRNEWCYTSAPPTCLHGMERDLHARGHTHTHSQTHMRVCARTLTHTHTK